MSPSDPTYPKTLALQFEAEGLSATVLRKAISNFDRLLRDALPVVLGEDTPCDVVFSMWQGSQVIAAQFEGGVGMQRATAVVADFLADELAALQGQQSRLAGLRETGIRALVALAEVGESNKLNFWVAGKPTVLATPIKTLAQSQLAIAHQDVGSIRGRLETISIHGKPKAVIYDSLHGSEITCLLSPELLEQARATLFGEVVEVEGTIDYRENGRPLRITARSFRRIRPATELRDFHLLRGILRGYA